jgi:hypothetical protein
MKHKRYREWLRLSIYDELDDSQKKRLADHLQGCDACRAEVGAFRRMHDTALEYKAEEPAPELLREARLGLQLEIARGDGSPPGPRASFAGIKALPHSRLRLALAAAALLFIGFMLGYASYSLMGLHPASQSTTGQDAREPSFGRIENLKFENPGHGDSLSGTAADRNVEFTFDSVNSIRMKGDLKDPRIQKILALALVNERNPGARLFSVSAMGASAPNAADPEIRSALIYAMQFDENPGVRMQAMETLARFPYDEKIKRAFLHVLINDRLSGLRIQAINLLTSGPMSEHLNDGETRKAFEEKLVHDGDAYIRLQATKVLRENSL